MRNGGALLVALALSGAAPAAAQYIPGGIQIGAPTEVVRFGVTGTQAQAAGWQPDPYGTPGIWVEDGAQEGGGFFANGNLAAIWSPADASLTVRNGMTPVSSVLLALYDEDSLSPGTGPRPEFIFSTYGIYAIDTWTGAHLTGGGAWANASDRTRKENVEAVDPRAILARLRTLPIYEWNYISEPDEVRHVGPMAQDFHAIFGLNGDDETHIATVDADGVVMASLVAVADENARLLEESRRVREENARLTGEVRALEARLSRLERLVAR